MPSLCGVGSLITATTIGVVAVFLVVVELNFTGIPVPSSSTEKHGVQWASHVSLAGMTITPGNEVLIRTGEEWRASHPYEGDTFGQMFGLGKVPITQCSDMDRYGGCPATSVDLGHQQFSAGIDFSSMMGDGAGGMYMVVHLEAPLPSTTYLLELAQNATTGELRVRRSTWMDWSEYSGLWVPCSGSLSPWGSHLGTEEYEPDARSWEAVRGGSSRSDVPSEWSSTDSPDPVAFGRYWGVRVDNEHWAAKLTARFNPYMYGWPFEVQVGAGARYKVAKHFALGRRSGELAYVMPDQRTVYLTDDGVNTHLSMFVADAAGDLSAGVLYCAKATQTTSPSDSSGGSFDLTWLSMGHVTAGEVEAAVRARPRFSELFERREHPCAVCNGTRATCRAMTCTLPCPEGFVSVNAFYEGAECLRVRPGKALLASRLEARRYCAVLGGTTEFRKMEGFSYADPAGGGSGRAYLAMSEITRGMGDGHCEVKQSNSYDLGGPNHVQLPSNPCGCVYELLLGPDLRATSMRGLLCGVPKVSGQNTCDLEHVANPDNLAVVHGHGGLLIAEDGKGHQNDVMWFYEFSTRSLTRIFRANYGAEVSTPFWFPDPGHYGFSYIIGAAQHPYMERDQHQRNSSDSTGMAAWLTYISWPKASEKAYPVPSIWGRGYEPSAPAAVSA